MKIRFNLMIWIGLAVLVLGACTPAASPTPTPPPTTAPPTLEPPTVVPSPTLVPVTLAGPQAGATMPWMDGGLFVFVPAGEFTMGSGLQDAPQRTVYLGDYWISRTEVTNSMYAFCVKVGACAPPAQELGTPLFDNPLYANYPVVGVSWDMAANYCTWMGGSLPTEAQWEKAARGAAGPTYPWGMQPAGCDKGNFSGCLGATSDVIRYADVASPYEALDMAGNVFEWVNDYYGASYYNSAPTENPPGPGAGEYRVIRGSSFESSFDQVAAAIRHYGANEYHSRDLGFRCAIQQPPQWAPMCQASSYIPSAVTASGECQAPTVSVGASYCEFNKPFTSVDLSSGASYELLTEGYTCKEAVIDGQRRLTCSGLDGTTGEVRVCNQACSSQPGVTGASPVCDAGYGLDADTGSCLYDPADGEPGVAGCPAGYLLIDRGGAQTCAPGPGGDGFCPDGTYLDESYGACVSAAAGVELPVGLNNPDLAARNYQGCLPGFSYSADFQCCQPNVGGTYPGCPLGSRYDGDAGTCVPDQLRLSGPGCVTVKVNMLQCNEPYQIQICKAIKNETTCIKNQVYNCQWDDTKNVCEYVK